MLFRDGLTDFTDKDLLTVRYPPAGGPDGVSVLSNRKKIGMDQVFVV